MDFFSKCHHLAIFTKEIYKGKLHLLCTVPSALKTNFTGIYH